MQTYYSVLIERWFERSALKVAFDQFVYTPVVYIPSFYLVTGELRGQTLSSIWEDLFVNGLLAATTEESWLIWIPAQAITFTIVPPQLRVAFVAAVGFVWNMVLEATANG